MTTQSTCEVSFNPCFNGSWSESDGTVCIGNECMGFNPCFNGSWSERVMVD